MTHGLLLTARCIFPGALTLGFALRATTMREADGKYWAQVFREDIPGMSSIDAVTRPLYDLALQFEGSYDGLESVVVRAEPPAEVQRVEATSRRARFMQACREWVGMR